MTKFITLVVLCLVAIVALEWRVVSPVFRILPALWSAKSEWRTPIEFYGKVVDEGEAPVPNAQIDFSCNDVSATGTSNYRRTSDGNGLFSISRIRGKLLVVKVVKDGYYTS